MEGREMSMVLLEYGSVFPSLLHVHEPAVASCGGGGGDGSGRGRSRPVCVCVSLFERRTEKLVSASLDT